MKVLYAQLCDNATTRPDGRLDVHGVFHQLYAPGFPARQDHLVLVLAVEWAQDKQGRVPFSIDLMDPSQSPVLTINGHTDVSPTPAGQAPPLTRLVMPLDHVVFPTAGTYHFAFKAEGETFSLAPLHLIEDPNAR